MSNASLAPTHIATVRLEMLLFVLFVPSVLAYTDAYLLDKCKVPSPSQTDLWVTYIWFCLQTLGMAIWVGFMLDRSPWWWCVLAWTVLLIDLQVFAIADSHSVWGGPARTLAFAFISAQSGLAVVWGLLGAENWRMRLPIGVGLLVWALSLGSALQFDEMMLLLMGQTLACAVFCLLLRSAGFRFARSGLILSGNAMLGPGPAQFSIRHLFYWTTALAILSGIGRFLDWTKLLNYVPVASIPHLLSYTALLMLVSMVATWAALGRERWLTRLLLGSLLLPAAGACLGFLELFIPRSSMAGLWLFWAETNDRILNAAIWTSLAGAFLACILFVFRIRGQRLYRARFALPLDARR